MSGRRTRRDTNGGFLLTETLATFAISAVVLVGLVSVSSVLVRAVDRSVVDVQGIDDLERTLAAIKRDLSETTRARFDGVEPQPFVFRGGPNSVFFARRDRGSSGILETRVVALREIVAGPTTRLTRADARLSTTATSFADLRYGTPRDLATGTARLRFSYVGRHAPQDPRTTPSTTWTSGRALPVAVLVDAIDVATNRTIVSTRIPIRADGDIGCIGTGTTQPGGSPSVPPPTATGTQIGAPSPPPFTLTPGGSASDDAFCAAAASPGGQP